MPALLAFVLAVLAAEVPPAPQRYFNDYAGFVSADAGRRLDEKLRRFDEESSNQVVVAIFRELPSPAMEDFTVRTAQAWRVGRRKLDNGVVFFVFVKERRMRLEVGYGLEGALPDVVAKRILEDVVAPRLGAGQPEAGLEAGIDAIVAATRGEYRPAARPRPEDLARDVQLVSLAIVGVSVALLLAFFVFRRDSLFRRHGGASWDSGGYRGGGWPFGGGFGGFSGGGGGPSGGRFSGGGGGFSAGGGSFGGGGASGRW